MKSYRSHHCLEIPSWSPASMRSRGALDSDTLEAAPVLVQLLQHPHGRHLIVEVNGYSPEFYGAFFNAASVEAPGLARYIRRSKSK